MYNTRIHKYARAHSVSHLIISDKYLKRNFKFRKTF